MDKDDENYSLMLQRRDAYMELIFSEAQKSGVDISAWEEEEIEMAFEHAFAQGFVCGNQKRKLKIEDLH